MYRYTGVSWSAVKSKRNWEAYINVADQWGNRTVEKGVAHFFSEVDAAVAADCARVHHVSGTHVNRP